ncbi:MAG: hypothetical protein ACP5L4_01995 [Thermoplasmata archaeon]
MEGDGIMLNKISRTLIFMGDFYFQFYIILIMNIFKLNYLGIYISTILLVISIVGIFYFIRLILKRTNFQIVEKTIESLDDRTNLFLIYIISYISIIPLFTVGVNILFRLFACSIIIFTIYTFYISSELLFYNPSLSLIGYKYFKATIKEGGEIFILASPNKEIKVGQNLSVYMLTDYIYYLSQKPQSLNIGGD